MPSKRVVAILLGVMWILEGLLASLVGEARRESGFAGSTTPLVKAVGIAYGVPSTKTAEIEETPTRPSEMVCPANVTGVLPRETVDAPITRF